MQFSASASGVPTNVHWSVDGVAGGSAAAGTISPQGVYTALANAGQHTITAVGVSNPGLTGTAQVLPPSVTFGTAAVLTHHNDNLRTGQNLSETALTVANVNSKTFGKLFSLPVDGEVFAEPLYVPNLTVAGIAHNVLIVATEHDSVYAFDADGLSQIPLWKTSLINPAMGITPAPSCEVQSHVLHITPEVGITGTPVIDASTQTLYVVAETKEGTGYAFRLYALDLHTGAQKFGSPVVIQGQVAGSSPFDGDGNGHILFAPGPLMKPVLQRPALLLVNGLVYVAFGSQEDIEPYHGWVFAFNAQTLAQAAIFNTTPNGAGQEGGKGAIWQSGGGPAADAAGNIFVQTGNGTFDAQNGGVDYGDTVLKLSGGLSVADWFTPFDEATLQQQDLDVGASGPLALPDQSSAVPHVLITGSKAGKIYVLNRDSLGHFNPAGDTQVVQEFANAPVFSTPAYWNQNVYVGGIGDVVRQFSVNNGQLAQVAQGAEVFRYPGTTPIVSANANTNGIVWALDNSAAAKAASCSALPGGGPAILRAYENTNISRELYNSAQASGRDVAGPALRFGVPTAVNGHVYVPTQNSITVYGLLP